MGDADCTYDFRQLDPFVERFREGYEYVMGSRWKGSIEPGSMPALHRYFGTPFTTWILNRLYSSHFSDIHCGMRGITRDALERMNLQSQSWEYASEMVLKSVHMELRTAEVPVTFLKDREGRLSHHKREGWLSPFKAAWINLRAMFVYGSDFFLFKPGIALIVLGLLLTLPLTFGDIDLGAVALSLNWQFLGVAILAVGCQTLLLRLHRPGAVRLHGPQQPSMAPRVPVHAHGPHRVRARRCSVSRCRSRWSSPTSRTTSRSSTADTVQNHLAVTGLAAAITGAQLFVFDAAAARHDHRHDACPTAPPGAGVR